eukprot:3589114-Rhodomonas_salina.2
MMPNENSGAFGAAAGEEEEDAVPGEDDDSAMRWEEKERASDRATQGRGCCEKGGGEQRPGRGCNTGRKEGSGEGTVGEGESSRAQTGQDQQRQGGVSRELHAALTPCARERGGESRRGVCLSVTLPRRLRNHSMEVTLCHPKLVTQRTQQNTAARSTDTVQFSASTHWQAGSSVSHYPGTIVTGSDPVH